MWNLNFVKGSLLLPITTWLLMLTAKTSCVPSFHHKPAICTFNWISHSLYRLKWHLINMNVQAYILSINKNIPAYILFIKPKGPCCAYYLYNCKLPCRFPIWYYLVTNITLLVVIIHRKIGAVWIRVIRMRPFNIFNNPRQNSI